MAGVGGDAAVEPAAVQAECDHGLQAVLDDDPLIDGCLVASLVDGGVPGGSGGEGGVAPDKIPEGATEGPAPELPGVINVTMKKGQGYVWFASAVTGAMKKKHPDFSISASQLEAQMQGVILHPITYALSEAALLSGAKLTGGRSDAQIARDQKGMKSFKAKKATVGKGGGGPKEEATTGTDPRAYEGKTFTANGKSYEILRYIGVREGFHAYECRVNGTSVQNFKIDFASDGVTPPGWHKMTF